MLIPYLEMQGEVEEQGVQKDMAGLRSGAARQPQVPPGTRAPGCTKSEGDSVVRGRD